MTYRADDHQSATQTGQPPQSAEVSIYLADLLRSHLKAIHSPWRSLSTGRIAVLVLAMLRHDQRLLDLAGGNNVPESTLRRWRDEMINLLAAKAPRLDRALRKIARQGGEVVLIDGTLIPTQRRTGKANRPNYSGKHHRHGLHFLALTDEEGNLIWISAARPGRTHDATAARHDHILEHLKAAGLGALADLGLIGVDKQEPRRPGHRHRLQGHPGAQAHPGAEAGQPDPGRRTRPRRTRLRAPESMANPHQAPHQPHPRHHPPARPARPDEP